MTNRIELTDEQMEDVVGGILKWKGGTVYPKGNESAKYSYTDYTKCQQWIVENWNGVQDEACLKALEAAGYVHKQ